MSHADATFAALGDTQRRALYAYVRGRSEPVGRDEAASAVGLARSTAAFHLDRLVEARLLTVEFQRAGGRSGPGAGRPAKLYRAAVDEASISLPPRRYDLAAELLAEAVSRSDVEGVPVRDALTEAAAARGRELGEGAGGLDAALTACGYEPVDDGAGGLALTNCPFHRLAQRHTELICTANAALIDSAASAAGETERTIERVPAEGGGCCVRLTAPGESQPLTPP